MTPEVPLLTTNEVLRYLRINRRTLYRLLKHGRIPATRVGREWRFRQSDLDAWLEARRTGTGPAPPEPDQPTSQTVGSGRKTILLVQPDEPLRGQVRSALLRRGHRVAGLADGLAALASVRARPYDLLITDLRLPGLGGLSLIRAARQVRPELPVIVLTAHSTEEDAIDALNLGVVGYLTHPYEVRELLGIVARALGDE